MVEHASSGGDFGSFRQKEGSFQLLAGCAQTIADIKR